MALIYLSVAMSVLIALCSLAVDFGRVQLTKTQLQNATDAAARYAAKGLSDNSYLAKAQAAAADNPIDACTLTLQSGDVVKGNYASGTFTANGSPTNAVQVTASLSAARGNGVPMLFAKVLGVQSCDVHATSVSLFVSSSGQNFGIVGVSSLTINGTTNTDSYNSGSGAYSAASALTNGGLASNGTIVLNSGTGVISSNLYMQSGQTLTNWSSESYGSRQALASPLNYATPSAGTITSTNNNSSVGTFIDGSGNLTVNSGTCTVPAGNYYLQSLTLNTGTLIISGAARFYVNGSVNFNGGTLIVSSSIPSDFTINVVTASTIAVNTIPTNKAYMYINAPTSTINFNSSYTLYGAFIGKTVTFNNTTTVHVDEAITGGSSGSGSGTITTVQ